MVSNETNPPGAGGDRLSGPNVPDSQYLIALTGPALAALKRAGHPPAECLAYEGARVRIVRPAHPFTTRLFGEPAFCVECDGQPVPFVMPRSCLEVVE